MDFENKKTKTHGIPYSRYIASWNNIRKGRFYYGEFVDWLQHLGLTKEEINGIAFLADNGKLELEDDARKFIKNNQNGSSG